MLPHFFNYSEGIRSLSVKEVSTQPQGETLPTENVSMQDFNSDPKDSIKIWTDSLLGLVENLAKFELQEQSRDYNALASATDTIQRVNQTYV
jgi:hypothetical protein